MNFKKSFKALIMKIVLEIECSTGFDAVSIFKMAAEEMAIQTEQAADTGSRRPSLALFGQSICGTYAGTVRDFTIEELKGI